MQYQHGVVCLKLIFGSTASIYIYILGGVIRKSKVYGTLSYELDLT